LAGCSGFCHNTRCASLTSMSLSAPRDEVDPAGHITVYKNGCIVSWVFRDGDMNEFWAPQRYSWDRHWTTTRGHQIEMWRSGTEGAARRARHSPDAAEDVGLAVIGDDDLDSCQSRAVPVYAVTCTYTRKAARDEGDTPATIPRYTSSGADDALRQLSPYMARPTKSNAL
jgi:hypothetical protein